MPNAFSNYREANISTIAVDVRMVGLRCVDRRGIAFDRVRFAERQKLVLAYALLAERDFPFEFCYRYSITGDPRGSPFSDRTVIARSRDHAGLGAPIF